MSTTDALKPLDVAACREQFPALNRHAGGRDAVFFDGPAGSQVPRCVMDAMVEYLSHHNANGGGVFATSRESDAVLAECHQVMAAFFGTGDADTIAFGANTTSLVFALSRALGRTWQHGDEIVVTRLEHDSNFTPWIRAAEDAGAVVRYADIVEDDCTLDLDDLRRQLTSRTRLVAVAAASNAVGTINPIAQIAEMAHEVGALLYVDAVHYAPHALLEVEAWQCDFLCASAYKFFGPHLGIQWGRRELLESLPAYKLRPAPDGLPGRWMTGTQSHEAICGARAAVEYIAQIGREVAHVQDLRGALAAAYQAIGTHERAMALRLLEGMTQMPGVKVWGITDPKRIDERAPTFSITHDRLKSVDLARKLDERGIFVWHGNYYALPLTERLGLEPEGMVRIGPLHYNTLEEVDYFLAVLESL